MNLAAMIGLGVETAYLQEKLSLLGLDHEFEFKTAEDKKNGIFGTRVDIILKDMKHSGHDGHRNLNQIEAIINNSRLNEKTKQTSLQIFRKLAEAEAVIHRKQPYEVHFHEVGATDSIVDIVGAAICYDVMDIDNVWSSPVELGMGFVECTHGIMPVPAPATAEILKGIPTTRGGADSEATTPTGASILAVLVDRFTASPELIVEKTAYGIGHRNTKIPNVLRVQLARTHTASSRWNMESATLLQCNIDDMTPEMLGVVMNLLLEKGAQDVHFTPILMKKNRPATSVSVLCTARDKDKFKQLLFKHTTTLGIKSFPLEKTTLDIKFDRLKIPLGTVTMKHAMMDGEIIRSKPEFEDCRKLAADHDISLKDVYDQIGKTRQ